MVIRAAPERPVIFTFAFTNRQIVDAGMANGHKAVILKLPVFVTVRPKPVAGIVMPLVGEANRNPVAGKGPQLFDQPVIKLARPLAGQKRDDLFPADRELGPVAPTTLFAVSQGDWRSGSRVFQPSSAARTFWIAVSRSNGGQGGCKSIFCPIQVSISRCVAVLVI